MHINPRSHLVHFLVSKLRQRLVPLSALLPPLLRMPDRLSRKLGSKRREPPPLTRRNTRRRLDHGRHKVPHLDDDLRRYRPRRIVILLILVPHLDHRKHLSQGADRRLPHERTEVRSAEPIAPGVARNDFEIDVGAHGSSLRLCAKDLDALGGRGEVDVEELVESAGTDHGGVEDVGSVRGADDENLFSGFEAVEFGEEGVDDAGGGFGLWWQGGRGEESVCEEARARRGTYEGVVAPRDHRIQLIKEDDARRRSARSSKHLPNRSFTLSNVLYSNAPSATTPSREKEEERTLLSNSGPLTEIKLALLSFATALANNVFPHPGGPHSNTPQGAWIPSIANTSGLRIGLTMLIRISSLIALSAPRSDQVTSGTVVKPSR